MERCAPHRGRAAPAPPHGHFAGKFELGAIKEVCAIDDQTAARVADLTARLVAKIQVDYESFSVDVERLIDAGSVVVMEGHYVGEGKATGKSVRAAVAHVLEISDGKIVRFDQ